VAWETGTNEVTVGDLPKTLTSSSNPAAGPPGRRPGRLDAERPDRAHPVLDVEQSGNGQATATISASWTAPTLNTDGSVLTDLAYYLVQYRWHGRARSGTPAHRRPTIDIPRPGRRAAPTTCRSRRWTPGRQHLGAHRGRHDHLSADSTAPNPPSDPVVSSYLGQLRIAWDGKDNAGAAMPTDFAYVEVHVSATSGFTPDSSPGSATLVAQLSTAGAAYATAPYGATRYVKLVAVDNSSQNRSPRRVRCPGPRCRSPTGTSPR
jgi:hypothetical protein